MQVAYRFEIAELLDESWKDWFAPLEIESTGEGTVLRGQVEDRSALYGTVLKMRDLGLTLLSLTKEESE